MYCVFLTAWGMGGELQPVPGVAGSFNHYTTWPRPLGPLPLPLHEQPVTKWRRRTTTRRAVRCATFQLCSGVGISAIARPTSDQPRDSAAGMTSRPTRGVPPTQRRELRLGSQIARLPSAPGTHHYPILSAFWRFRWREIRCFLGGIF